MPTVDYLLLARSLEDVTPKARIATDHLRTLSYGTDASFYRLIPRIVVTVQSEAEVIGVMARCAVAGAPDARAVKRPAAAMARWNMRRLSARMWRSLGKGRNPTMSMGYEKV